jgi:signal transduction histidine kinase/CheY-like chemotaxis protein
MVMFIGHKKSIRKKIITVTLVVTFIALLLANGIELVSSYIIIQNRSDIPWDYFGWRVIIHAITGGLGLIFAYFLAIQLVNFITRPIYHLSGLAATLAEKQDYALRANKYSDDELGLLTDAFNAMIIAMGDNAEKLKAANDATAYANQKKSDFLAMMSHEIRTPLNGIIGTAELLGETKLSGRQKEYVDIIEKSGATLFDLINDILDFSKIEAQKMRLESLDFDLLSLIHDVIDILEMSVKQKGLDLKFNNQLDCDYHVMGDPTRLKQILINLIGNAIKFTENGSITVTIAEDMQVKNDNDIKQIWFSVTDTGIGIPNDRQIEIFESFSQGDSTTTRRFGGSGLGLSICSHLVTMMGGTLGVDSIEGNGSTFWFSIPMPLYRAPKTDIIAPYTQTETTTITVNKKPQIILAEDNETNIMITSEILIQSGYDVILCRDGAETLACYQNHPVQLILMDCFMPIMDGWESTRAIRKFESENNQIVPATIIALTANAMEGDRDKCIAEGMNDYIAKPFKKADLLNKINEWTS